MFDSCTILDFISPFDLGGFLGEFIIPFICNLKVVCTNKRIRNAWLTKFL